MDTPQDLQLTMRMPKAVAPGESVSVTVDVVSIKSKAGGSPVELTIDPIPAPVTAAGMTLITLCTWTSHAVVYTCYQGVTKGCSCCRRGVLEPVLLPLVLEPINRGAAEWFAKSPPTRVLAASDNRSSQYYA